MMISPARTFLAAIAMLALAACDRSAPDEADAAPEASPTATGTESILRPDIEAETQIEIEIPPLIASVGFGDSGSDLTDAAKARLDALLAEPQFAEGWPITLGGHSDAGGRDEVNLRISQERAQAVADYLIAKGISARRINVIAFGEQNPVAPNALPDGEPDEAGRAQNRRVDIVVSEAGSLDPIYEESEEEAATNDIDELGQSPPPPR